MKFAFTIKDFLRPTKAKIGLTVLIFILVSWLVNIFPFADDINTLTLPKKILYCLSVPDVYLSEVIIFPIFELNSPNETDAFDSWFPYWLFFLMPMRVIYEYIISCIIISILRQKREKK